MKRFTLIIFLILNTFIFPSALNRDIDIIDMPLHEVLAVLSKETGKNLICSKEAKDIVIDTYFNKGEDVNSVLQFLAESYDLSMKKENNTTIFILQSEKNTKKAKIIGKVTSNNMALKNAKIELKDLNKIVYTDSSGNFIIDNIPKDVYVCKISKKGYEERGLRGLFASFEEVEKVIICYSVARSEGLFTRLSHRATILYGTA